MGFEVSATIISNKLYCRMFLQEDVTNYEYAYYFFRNGQRLQTIWYSSASSITFDIAESGDYYVQVFARKAEKPDLMQIKTSCVFHHPSAYQLILPKVGGMLSKLYQMIRKTDESKTFTVQIVKDRLECRWHPNVMNEGEKKNFQLVENNRYVEQYLETDQNSFAFALQRDGAYHVECAVVTDQGLEIFRSKICNYIIKEEKQEVSLIPPTYTMSPKPFVDFCVIASKNTLPAKMMQRMEGHGMSVCRKQKLGGKIVTLFAPKDFALVGDILLSGFIYEKVFVYGQEHIGKLPVEFLDEMTFSEMTGTFTAVKYQDDGIVVTTDLFGAGHLYCYEDQNYMVVSGRLHQTLLAMRSLGVCPEMNKDYIAANLCYDEKMLSVTNFTTNLIFKGLQFLPLNQYIKISEAGIEYKTKSMVYEQMPYDDAKYSQLLDQAKEDILAKVNAIAESGIFGRYIQEVTGGFDSRVALSATLNCPQIVDKMRIWTIDVNTSQDLRCSLILTNNYRLPYCNLLEDPVKIIPVTLEKADEENRSLAMGLYGFNHITAYARCVINQVKSICFGGYFGETMRSRYFGGMQNRLSIEDTAADIVRKFMQRVANDVIAADSKCKEQFAERLKKQIEQMPGHTAVEKFDNMYTFFYLRFHFGLGEYYLQVTHSIRIAPFMSKYMLYASKMLTMQQRYENKIMYEMAHLLKPEIIAFPYSSYGLQDENIQLDSHKQGLLLKEPNQLHVELDFDDHKYRSVAQSNIDFNRRCDEQLAKSEQGAEKRDVTRFVYLRLHKLLEVLEHEKQLTFIPWQEVRAYAFAHQKEASELQQLYAKLMGIYDQLHIVLKFF
ncbi:MAG: hypothetical protein RR413_02735 [Christensenellaceae bacterium]